MRFGLGMAVNNGKMITFALKERDVEIYESSLSTKENELLVQIIRENWEYIDQKLTKSFEGLKTEVKEIKQINDYVQI